MNVRTPKSNSQPRGKLAASKRLEKTGWNLRPRLDKLQRFLGGSFKVKGTPNPNEYFGPSGRIAQAMTNYEVRPEQVAMMDAVQAAIATSDVCLIEAGTGVGKTLAYLVPSVISGRQTVVATGTKALMDQIYGKDVPFLNNVLAESFTAVLLKGRSNYLCLTRLKEARVKISSLNDEDRAILTRVRKWALRTDNGDIAELADLPEGTPMLRTLTSSVEDCGGRMCPDFADCFVYKARARALKADLVITNHHLLIADMALSEDPGGPILPAEANLIIDEAHGLEDVATELLGRTLTSHQVSELGREVAELAKLERTFHGFELKNAASGIVKGFAGFLAALAPTDTRRKLESNNPKAKALWHELDIDLEAIELRTLEIAKELDRAPDVSTKTAQARALLAEVMVGFDTNLIRLVERKGRFGAVSALPVTVSEILEEKLFLTGRPVILTSATLTVDGSTEFLRSRLGVPEGAPELVLASPFNFQKQAIIYAPKELPAPDSALYFEHFINETMSLLTATHGRAFVLFTSRAAMLRATQAARSELTLPILCQGEAPRHELLRQFKATKGACLFGTASFWEGVDVVGDALSLVIIDRLPFDPPDDPILQARVELLTEAGRNSFKEYNIPLAVIKLRQGFGRLIRSRTDRGIVAILDSRIRTRSYGNIFLRSLPPAPVLDDLEEVKDWAKQNLKKRRRR